MWIIHIWISVFYGIAYHKKVIVVKYEFIFGDWIYADILMGIIQSCNISNIKSR